MHSHKNCIQCRHDSREEALAVMRLDVAQYTTVNIAVPGSRVEKRAPFTYSIGLLEHFDQPEIIITGLNTETAHFFLNSLRETIKEGKRLEADKVYTEFARDDLPLIFKSVSAEYLPEFLGYGLDYYRTYEPHLFERFAAWQMVWSDTKGKLPWEVGYEFPANVQPLLFEHTAELLAIK